jgi:hypothetical protein
MLVRPSRASIARGCARLERAMYTFSYHAIAPFVSHVLSVVVAAFLIAKNTRSSEARNPGAFLDSINAKVLEFVKGNDVTVDFTELEYIKPSRGH